MSFRTSELYSSFHFLRYDSLVHSQVRELSFQCQQIKEIRCGCVTYHEHLSRLLGAFEELLQASHVDADVAEGFREQLNQSVLLFEKLEMKFLYGEQHSCVLVVD